MPTSVIPKSYLEFFLANIPRKDGSLKHILRATHAYLPMPLGVGWNPNSIQSEYPKDCMVDNLLLTDIESGGTRSVVAPWMHALYKDSKKKNGSNSSVFVKFGETNFEAGEWPVVAVMAILLAQFGVAQYALHHGCTRDATMLVIGIILQIMEGLGSYLYPKYYSPRRSDQQRSYALHTGMTTTHILVLQHDPSMIEETVIFKTRSYAPRQGYVNLEDVAVPWERESDEITENLFKRALLLANWAYHTGFALFPSDNLLVAFVLLGGTLGSEAVQFATNGLPRQNPQKSFKNAKGIRPLLDVICQHTNTASVGFVESILPDPAGTHKDYNEITVTLNKSVPKSY
ncbi:hypothetical protein M422DRAFT_29557 [Sphaerobolus stellatus SS14]|uniref:Uncharacterized protein n=1 Tax=Sphaerobolus stellatus (strain SS14) TaxID=990650 RepID=A0A0C9USV9_SPHS4|nr:hypothetical protein M422DRAFT_29557 [Sphaerobolus stellatus SS14]